MHKHIEEVADRYGFTLTPTGRGQVYTKVMSACDLPYCNEHTVDNQTVFDNTQVRFELEFVTGKMMIRQIIDDIQDQEEYDVNTEDGGALLAESAGHQPGQEKKRQAQL